MSSETLARLLRETGEGIEVSLPPHVAIESRSRRLSRQPRGRMGVGAAVLGVVLLGAFVSVIGGWDPEAAPSAASPVLTLPPQSGWATAEISGILSLQKGCLLVGERAVVWPDGTTWDQSDRSVRYEEESYPVGAGVSGGGAYYSLGQRGGDILTTDVWNAVQECAIATGVNEIVAFRPVGPAGDPPAAIGQLRCSTATDPTTLPLPPTGTIADGAVQARLCPTNGAGWQPPADILTTGVGDLIDLVNLQPRYESQGITPACFGDHTINDYAITFAYRDGETSAIWGDVCGDILRTGDAAKTDAVVILQTYLGALRDQRASRPVPSPASPPTCPDTDGSLPESILPTGNALNLLAATVCTYRWTEVGRSIFAFVLEQGSPLTSDQIRQVNAGFQENAIPFEPDYDVGDTLHTITGVTPWGDNVTLQLLNERLVRAPTPAQPGTQSLGWPIPPTVRAALFGS
jgi:hypothetical protein